MSNLAKLRYLSDAQVKQLHEAGVRLLTTYGIRVQDPKMRELLADHGCTVEGDRVKYAPDLVEKAIRNNRRNVTMRSFLTGATVEMEIGKTFTHSTGGAPWIADPKTGKRRNGTLQDLVDVIKIMNNLDGLDVPCALLYPSDVPSEISQFVQTATMFEYSKKPIYGPGVSTADNAKYIVELFKLFGGADLAKNPIGMVGVSPESPLFLPKEITDTLQLTVGAGIPVSILAAPMGGLTAPLTVVGTVAQAHAEILSFAVLSYLINPETVLFYGSRTFFANMRTGHSILGLPETGISSAIAVQLAEYCGFMSDVYGLSCTSCATDEQTGYEKMLNGLLPAMAQATLVTGFGSLASVMCCTLGQLVVDNDIVNMMKRANRDVAIDDDILGFEAIDAVVNDGETFLEQLHTVQYLRKQEIFESQIGFDSVWGDWIKTGEVPLMDRANEKAVELIEKDEPVPMDAGLKAEVDRLIDCAKKELLK